MPFLTKADLKTVAVPEIIDLITNNDDDTVDKIIAENIELIRTYLGGFYDADKIFNETERRNGVILKILKTLTIRDLYRIRRKSASQKDEEDYQEAMKFLEDVAGGKITVGLPKPAPKDLDGDGIADEMPFMRLGGRTTYSNHW